VILAFEQALGFLSLSLSLSPSLCLSLSLEEEEEEKKKKQYVNSAATVCLTKQGIFFNPQSVSSCL
jgi:hypothetical protein